MTTPPWTCDSCGQPIQDPHDGWIEWINFTDKNGERRVRDLRLVHHKPASPQRNGCQFDGDAEWSADRGTISDLSLEDFLGPDGLMNLLEMIDERAPVEGIVEMIKRLHIPYYEQARPHFERAIDAGAFEPNTREKFYTQSQIRRTLDFAERSDED